MAIFNEKNLRRLINEKVDASASKIQEQLTTLRKDVDNLIRDIRGISADVSKIKSLPIFWDTFKNKY